MGGRTGETVIVARLDSEGDVLLAGPAVRAVAARAGRVVLLAGPRGAAAARLLPGVDEVLVRTAMWIDPEPGAVTRGDALAFADAIAAVGASRALVLGSFHQSPLPTALLLRMAGVPWIGADCEDYPGSLLDLRHRRPDGLHEAEAGVALAAAAGFPPPWEDDGRLRVRRGEGAVPEGLTGAFVAVHPGASVPARAWSADRHRDLVAELSARGHAVVVTGGPGERDLTAHVASGAAGAVDLGGRTTLADLAEVLAAARAVVVGNTGPAHLAAAVGTPVAWLHAPTVPAARWHPWGVPYVRLAVPVPCGGCRARECPVPGHPCLEDVPASRVVRAVEALAGRPAPLVEAAA